MRGSWVQVPAESQVTRTSEKCERQKSAQKLNFCYHNQYFFFRQPKCGFWLPVFCCHAHNTQAKYLEKCPYKPYIKAIAHIQRNHTYLPVCHNAAHKIPVCLLVSEHKRLRINNLQPFQYLTHRQISLKNSHISPISRHIA